MRLTRIGIDRDASRGRSRLWGEVHYEKESGSETVWFEVPTEYENDLTTSGDPWLVCLLPLAMTLGEPLRLPASVDRTLLAGSLELGLVWKMWYPDLHAIPVETDWHEPDGSINPSKTGAFFSGGVDSFYTVLRLREPEHPVLAQPIDDLLMIHGADVPLNNPAAFARMLDCFRAVACELEKTLVDTSTNLRETRWGAVDWPGLSHGSLLGATGLALQKRYSRLLIASSLPYRNLEPWGSHYVSDPLFSTSRTRFIYYGAGRSRLEKTELLAKSDLAMRSLRVCWRSPSGTNCGACAKCYRTMISLELAGALERCSTFQEKRLDLKKVARVYCDRESMFRQFTRLREAALMRERRDVARALTRAMWRSRAIAPLHGLIKPLARTRLLWRAAALLQSALLKNSIRE